MLGKTLYELLGGNVRDSRNNILKSFEVTAIDSDGTVELTTEPYDNAYNIEYMGETVGKLVRTLNRREKSIFKALGNPERVLVNVYDDFSTVGAIYKTDGEPATTSINGYFDNESNGTDLEHLEEE